MKPRLRLLLAACCVALLAGCDNDDDDDIVAPPAPEPVQTEPVNGSGVKGPLAGAVVELYAIDLAQANIQGELIDDGSTGPDAAIQDLAVPADTTGKVLLLFVVDDDTTDLTTGAAPLFDSLTTVVDAQRLIDGESVYASPLTTMAVDLAVAKGDSGSPYAGNGDGTLDEAEFAAALDVAQGQVKSTLGFGMDSTIDIFTVPPLLTNDTDTADEQGDVAAYRQAIEAVTAISAQIAADVQEKGGTASPQDAFNALTEDLTDGDLDGESEAGPIETVASLAEGELETIVTQDVTTLTIPGTETPIGEIESVLAAETEDTGAETDTTDLESGAVSVDPEPAETETDIDGDGVSDSADAFPSDPTETVDTDGDEVGDNSDAFPEDPTETADGDGDGVGDNADQFPDDPTRTAPGGVWDESNWDEVDWQ